MSETIAAAPLIADAPAPAPAAAPVEAPAPVAVEAPAPTPAPAPAAPEAQAATLLAEPPAAVEPAPAPEPPKVESQSDEPAPLPTYEPWKLPDGVTLEGERLENFTGLLAELEGETKADHAAVQKFGQRAIDLYVAETQRVAGEIQKSLQTSWENTKAQWLNDVKADAEIGGSRFETSVNEARQFIRTHAASDEELAQIGKFMNDTGAGNHPILIKLLSRAARTNAEPRPLAATKPAAAPEGKVGKLYGATSR